MYEESMDGFTEPCRGSISSLRAIAAAASAAAWPLRGTAIGRDGAVYAGHQMRLRITLRTAAVINLIFASGGRGF